MEWVLLFGTVVFGLVSAGMLYQCGQWIWWFYVLHHPMHPKYQAVCYEVFKRQLVKGVRSLEASARIGVAFYGLMSIFTGLMTFGFVRAYLRS